VPDERVTRTVEALLFAADAPVALDRIAEILPDADRQAIRESLTALREHYDAEGHAFTVAEVAGGWQLYCRPDYAVWVRELQRGRIPAKLSQAALETLAIVAYKQPLVRTEIEAIRGVDSSGVLATLLKRNLVTIAGRAPGMGRALMYRTTKEFLRYFGLVALTDLPRIQEFAEVLGLRSEDVDFSAVAAESLSALAADAEGAEDGGTGADDAGSDDDAPPPGEEGELAEPAHALGDRAILRLPDEA